MITDLVNAAITADTCNLTASQRNKLSDNLYDWLVNSAKKNQAQDLSKKLLESKIKIESFVKGVKIKFTGKGKESDTGFLIEAGPGDQEMLKWFSYGSLWFEPHPSLISAIIKASLS